MRLVLRYVAPWLVYRIALSVRLAGSIPNSGGFDSRPGHLRLAVNVGHVAVSWRKVSNSPLKPGSLSLDSGIEIHIRDVWRTEKRPATDIDRSDVIGKPREAARNTEEFSLSLSIRFINMTTTGASTRGVARVNSDHLDACLLGLVFDKGAELKERPTMQGCSLWLSSRYPLANTRQVFDGNSASGVFSRSNNAFGDLVVGIRSKAALFARKLFETTTRRFRAFSLQFGAQAPMSIAHILDRVGLEYRPLAGDGNVRDAQVHTQEIVRVSGGWLVNITALQQVELTLAVNQIAFTAQAFEQAHGVIAGDKRHLLTTVHDGYRDNPLIELIGDKAIIEGESALWLESALRFLVEFIAIGNFGKDTNGDIGLDALRPNVIITEFVQGELTERTRLPSSFADIVARSIGRFQCSKKCLVLFFRRFQLNTCHQFHALIIASIAVFVNYGNVGY